MQFPSLSRVFAVSLLILSFVMSLAGVTGLGKAVLEQENERYRLQKLREQLAEYQQLLLDNEGKEPYDSISAALSDLQEKHNEASADHRTELATYSATKGGIQTGVDALDQADAAMANARKEFEAQKKQLQAQKDAFMAQYEGYQQAVAGLAAINGQIAGMEAAQSSLSGLFALKSLPADHDPALLPEAYQTAIDQASADCNVFAGLDSSLVSDSQAEEARAAVQALRDGLAEPDVEDYNAQVSVLNGLRDGVSAIISGSIAAMEQQKAPLQQAVDLVEQTMGGAAGMEAAKQQFDGMEAGLQAAEEQIKSAENMLYHNRALIWYELGQLEEQAGEMQQTREALMQESEEIARKEQQTKEQKQREKRLRSLYLTFADFEEVALAIERGEDIVPVTELALDSRERQLQQSFVLRLLGCASLILTLPMAILSLLASFEKLKRLGLARVGALLVLGLAAAAMVLFFLAGQGMSYAALGGAILALPQIAFSGTRKKKA